MNAVEEVKDGEMDGAEVEQSVPEEENAQMAERERADALAKYKNEDGTLKLEDILADLKNSEERLEGLRKKLADKEKGENKAEPTQPTEKTAPTLEEEMKEELAAIGDESERAFAEKFIGLLGRGGLTKEKASELLSGLGELYQPEDPKEFFQNEMKKLGKDGKEMLNRVRSFRDAMRDSKEFGEEKISALEQITQTADGVQLIDKILEKARTMDSGKFSNRRPDGAGEELGHEDRIRLYEKAFALRRTSPAESEAEVARLDRMFVK
jgi:hypothetical protein